MNADASNPALHFGSEVKRARVAAGMTLAEMGRVVGYHKSQVSRVERGVRAPTRKFAQMCDLAFPGRGGWFLRFYDDSRQWSAMPPWFRNWIEHEQRAVNLRIWQPSSLSGLVQTETYALAQLRTFPGATAEQVAERLSARMARQTILTREMPAAPMLWFLIDEAALRRQHRKRADHGRAARTPAHSGRVAERHYSGSSQRRSRRVDRGLCHRRSGQRISGVY